MAKRQPIDLNGKLVAITGGARGIGAATAKAFSRAGAKVAIGDLDAQLALQTAASLPTDGAGFELDVTDLSSFERFIEAVEQQLGPVDVLVNNAGIMPVGPFEDETDDCARRLVDINVHGVILGSKLAIQRFKPRGRGHIVQLASIAGKGGFPGGVTYCATKHAVVGLTEGLRSELRGTGIELHQVLPIGVNTELYSGVASARGFPTAEPEDVASAIVELLQTGKFELYVPRTVGAFARVQALLPRRVMEAIIRFTKGDQLLISADPAARAAYEARIDGTGTAAPAREQTAA
jgi:NAD(P)-dependent dehydrogenase (short-subunit alcohol dehydrogenase family)